MPSWAIVDAGPLVAWAASDDARHSAVIRVLQDPLLQPVISALSLAEATYIVGSRLGADAEIRLVESATLFPMEWPRDEDCPRVLELMRQYRDFPLGLADATVVALAERLETDTIVTFDHRHFRAVRPRHCESFRLLP